MAQVNPNKQTSSLRNETDQADVRTMVMDHQEKNPGDEGVDKYISTEEEVICLVFILTKLLKQYLYLVS